VNVAPRQGSGLEGQSEGDFDVVEADEVSRHFGRRRALSKISFAARAGTITGLLGPNGAGKSTLIAVLATLLEPSAGSVRYGPAGSKWSSGAALRARIGLLGHDLYLYPELTARENLAFFAELYGLQDSDAAADRALAHAGLSSRAADPVSSFSRGMRQRVALERALVHGPRLLLLDEPFTGLDDASLAALVGRLRGLRQQGAIVILATHDLDVAEGLFDRVLFLREGRLVDRMEGSSALREAYRSAMAQ
jgi:ABC-type multidrug transport system ATPase subunit